MTESAVKQRLRAILAADAAGFSRLMADDEHATVAALDARARCSGRRSRRSRAASSTWPATRCWPCSIRPLARSLRHWRSSMNWPLATQRTAPQRRMHFRIGVHLGDVIEKPDGTVYGDGVNVAARLEGLAQPGGITVSDSVHGVVSGRVVATFTDQGEQTLKNIARPIRAFAIDLGLPPTAASAATGKASRPPRDSARGRKRGSACTPLRSPKPRPRPWPNVGPHHARRACSSAASRKWRSSPRRWAAHVRAVAGSCCWPAPAAWARPGWPSNWPRWPKQQGVPVLWGRCLEEPGAPPYWPWRQLIRSYLRSSGDADPALARSAPTWPTSPASCPRWPSSSACRHGRPRPATTRNRASACSTRSPTSGAARRSVRRCC